VGFAFVKKSLRVRWKNGNLAAASAVVGAIWVARSLITHDGKALVPFCF
jgi:hypothetical protein